MSKKVDTASQFIYSLQFSFGYNSFVCTWSAPSPQEMFQKTGLRSISKLLTLLCHDLWFMLHLWNFFKIIYSWVNYYLSSFNGFCTSQLLNIYLWVRFFGETPLNNLEYVCRSIAILFSWIQIFFMYLRAILEDLWWPQSMEDFI